MKSGMTFQERSKLGREAILKRPPTTLQKAREQVLKIKAQRAARKKKRKKD